MRAVFPRPYIVKQPGLYATASERECANKVDAYEKKALKGVVTNLRKALSISPFSKSMHKLELGSKLRQALINKFILADTIRERRAGK